ncbi:outer membrane protein assembly factor BamB [Inhella gelatinilytica]|uniref:Outer membrane protein assembly factor BamB n=1 Tax=Inhella gelatinilytica TaxID=2795030 RepID=A0A931IX25_9BURK|nr:outer membrane protein assembly factor BamB [Inhella gelatinilytica]MBH9553482.1 outer membrane protein assembly factor BamB [Inhella gelatinilytica]
MTRISQRLAAAAIVTTALAGCSWFGSDAPKPAALQAVTPTIAGRVVWSAKVGDVDFPLSVAATTDRFVVADASGQVRAFRSQDGAVLWQGDVGGKVAAGVGSDGRFAAVVTRDLDLVVMDAGRVLWRKRLTSAVATAPLVAGERVFVQGVDRVVHGFDALDGRRLWELKRPGDALLLAQPGVLAAFKDTLIVGQGARMAGVDPLRGTLRWEANVASPRGTNEVERLADLVGPVARQGDVLCARAFQAAVGCVNAQRGSLVWSRPSAGNLGVTADDRAVIGFDASDRLTAWRTENGETLWTSEDYQLRRLTAPVLAGAVVVFGDFEGQVHFLARDTGKAQLRVATGGGPLVTPIVRSGTTLLAVAKNGGVYALRPE